MAKRIDVYSILIRNGFKAPDSVNILIFRGYLHYFLMNVVEGQDAQDLKEKMVYYTDSQFRKLLFRLKENGHVLGSD